MSPELLSALYSVGSALIAAGAVWLKMRRGGAPVLPPPPDPGKPAQPVPAFPSTGRPVLDWIIKRFLEQEAAQAAQAHEAQAAAFVASLAPDGKPKA